VPRANLEVNQYWMCDEGRLNFRYVSSPRRLVRGTGRAREIAEIGKKLKFAGIVSSYQTIEEMFLFRKLMEALGAGPVAVLAQTRGDRQQFPSGFVIESDKTPNGAYAARAFGPGSRSPATPQIVSGLEAGTIQGLLVMNGIPDFPMPSDLVKAARRAQFLAVSDILENPLAEFAHVVLPGTAWAEKDGTFMNVDGRVQRVRKAVEPPVEARPEIEWLQEALHELGERSAILSAEGVFKEALPGMDYSKVGALGAKHNGQPVA